MKTTIHALVLLAVYSEMIAHRVAARATQIRTETVKHVKKPKVRGGPLDRWFVNLDFTMTAKGCNEQDIDQFITDLGSFTIAIDDPDSEIAENIETTHTVDGRKVKFVENIFRHGLIRVVVEVLT